MDEGWSAYSLWKFGKRHLGGPRRRSQAASLAHSASEWQAGAQIPPRPPAGGTLTSCLQERQPQQTVFFFSSSPMQLLCALKYLALRFMISANYFSNGSESEHVVVCRSRRKHTGVHCIVLKFLHKFEIIQIKREGRKEGREWGRGFWWYMVFLCDSLVPVMLIAVTFMYYFSTVKWLVH